MTPTAKLAMNRSSRVIPSEGNPRMALTLQFDFGWWDDRAGLEVEVEAWKARGFIVHEEGEKRTILIPPESQVA